MQLTTDNFDYLREFLRQKIGIVLQTEKLYLAESRLAPLAREFAGKDLNALIQKIRDPAARELRAKVLESMAIKETFFFRDPALMNCLRNQVLPELIANRSETRKLRIWSAACSTGQEAWTLALMLREQFPETATDWDIRILASDFSNEALDKARNGKYSHTEINRGMPARLLVSWFRQSGIDWEIDPQLRRMVEFRQINLVEEWPTLPTFDLVLLRNVLIYFDEITRNEIMTRMRRQVAPDGFLMLGGTERVQPYHGFAPGGHCQSLPCYQPTL